MGGSSSHPSEKRIAKEISLFAENRNICGMERFLHFISKERITPLFENEFAMKREEIHQSKSKMNEFVCVTSNDILDFILIPYECGNIPDEIDIKSVYPTSLIKRFISRLSANLGCENAALMMTEGNVECVQRIEKKKEEYFPLHKQRKDFLTILEDMNMVLHVRNSSYRGMHDFLLPIHEALQTLTDEKLFPQGNFFEKRDILFSQYCSVSSETSEDGFLAFCENSDQEKNRKREKERREYYRRLEIDRRRAEEEKQIVLRREMEIEENRRQFRLRDFLLECDFDFDSYTLKECNTFIEKSKELEKDITPFERGRVSSALSRIQPIHSLRLEEYHNERISGCMKGFKDPYWLQNPSRFIDICSEVIAEASAEARCIPNAQLLSLQLAIFVNTLRFDSLNRTIVTENRKAIEENRKAIAISGSDISNQTRGPGYGLGKIHDKLK